MTKLPQTMKAIIAAEAGPPNVLKLAERPTPKAGFGEILIAVKVAGVNRPDIMQRKGLYPAPKGASELLGLEVSGHIAAIGEGVEGHRIGDAVTALAPGGGYAEYCSVPASSALPLPKGLSMEEAAGIPETFFTVWTNVFDRAGLQQGETFLVHGGTSGIGSTAIQLAKAFGATVFTTAGSELKVEAARKFGAHHSINYKEKDFVSEILNITDKQGIDVILDMVGGDYVERNWKVAAMDGRICQLATLNGISKDVNFARLMMKRLVHTGSTLRPRSTEFKGKIAQELYQKVWPLLENKQIEIVVDRIFPLEEADKAHELMESSSHIGKILLNVA
ncbi:NAD(P)H-quinone oxidoreductase [Flexibacterium corallicola]|uniref:NAD(P)H-quinone oxidoreductase n=1 Tax=Flexibacterium corallicola TaxID=3037259 RepID=UPI00286F71FD|nr:NAD(P)H-quinone oxidoreductase [Pseudovibrio sp. M1P-2-3]